MRILSLLTAVLAISAAQAADLPLADTACTNYICFDATPNVSYVGTDSTYSSAIVMLDETLFSGPTTATTQVISGSDTITTVSAELHSADGRTLVLAATFRESVTEVNAGRLHTHRTNLELLSGTVSS